MTVALILAGTALLGVAMICLAGLTAWRGWLNLKRYELAAREGEAEAPETNGAVRIEMADLKERVRKLEAIATGIDI